MLEFSIINSQFSIKSQFSNIESLKIHWKLVIANWKLIILLVCLLC